MGHSAGIFKPLPFPTYAPDLQRQSLEKALVAVTSMILCSTFIPGIAGPNAALEVPVQSAVLHFTERIPATIELGWDTQDAQIAPASLGYFDSEGRLVYSASVARGLVYGQSDGTAWVLEIRAPLDGEVFLDPYLEAIRGQVVESNTIKNLLMQERLVDLCDGTNPKLDSAWRDVAPDLVAETNPYWVEKVLLRYPKLYQGIAVRLRDEAKHLGRLKELYYGSQQARLSLLVAQFDLQLAMTRYPTNEIESLSGMGDGKVAQATMSAELGRLKRAWKTRKSDLSKQLANDRHQLDSLAKPVQMWAGQARLGFSGWQAANGILLDEKPSTQQPNPQEQLTTCLIQARMVVASAEIQQLQAGLAKLDKLEQHVSQGVISTGNLSEYHVTRGDFSVLDIEAAKGLPEWESTLVGSPGRLASLELLASSFFGEEASIGGAGDSEWGHLAFSPYPNEVALGLWAIDLWTKQGGLAPNSINPGQGNPADLPVDELLSQVVAFPEDYTPESHHLAFLKFAGWYSSLVKKATAGFRTGDRF